jgi:hypothetical protein
MYDDQRRLLWHLELRLAGPKCRFGLDEVTGGPGNLTLEGVVPPFLLR